MSKMKPKFLSIDAAMMALKSTLKYPTFPILQSSRSRKTYIIPVVLVHNLWHCVAVIEHVNGSIIYAAMTRNSGVNKTNRKMYWESVDELLFGEWDRVEPLIKEIQTKYAPTDHLKEDAPVITDVPAVSEPSPLERKNIPVKKAPVHSPPRVYSVENMNPAMVKYWEVCEDDGRTGEYQRMAITVWVRDNCTCQWCGDSDAFLEIWNTKFTTSVRQKDWDANDCIAVCDLCKESMEKVTRSAKVNIKDLQIIRNGRDHAWLLERTPRLIYVPKGRKDIIMFTAENLKLFKPIVDLACASD